MYKTLIYWNSKEVTTYLTIDHFLDVYDEPNDFSDIHMATEIVGEKIKHYDSDDLETLHKERLKETRADKRHRYSLGVSNAHA